MPTGLDQAGRPPTAYKTNATAMTSRRRSGASTRRVVIDGQNPRPSGLQEAGRPAIGTTRVPHWLAVTSTDLPSYKLSNHSSTILEEL
jgi:hypothetical protein